MIGRDQIRAAGLEHLQKVPSAAGAVGHWKQFLTDYAPRPELPDDAYAWLSCTLALAGVASDNYGVGAVLVAADGQVVAQGHNQMFHPYFRSDWHAEMVVLERWEDSRPSVPWPGGLTLVTSVEPCPMCLVRLLTADVRRVLFASADDRGGMVQHLDNLPSAWREMAASKTFAPARCAPELADAAARIFQINLAELNARLNAR